MVNIGAIVVHVSGDIGGIGQSKLYFQRTDATTPTVSDCNAAGAAVHALYQSMYANVSDNTASQVQGLVELVDHATAAPGGILALSSVPAQVNGLASGNFAAGVGGRMNWKTGSVHNRRYIRGCTFFTPFTPLAYTGDGEIASGVITAANTAAATYITAMGAASLDPIIWHRPPVGTFSGGAVGLITAGILSATPGSLRSRRVLR